MPSNIPSEPSNILKGPLVLSDTQNRPPNTPSGPSDTFSGLPNILSGLPNTPSSLPDTPCGLPNTPSELPNTPSELPNTPSGLPNTPSEQFGLFSLLKDKLLSGITHTFLLNSFGLLQRGISRLLLKQF